MKLLWFHLMPYTELPDDFREKHPSVWRDAAICVMGNSLALYNAPTRVAEEFAMAAAS